jgi:hypothetical protein
MHRRAHGCRVLACTNTALLGVFAKHSRSFSLIDSLAVGVDRTQRNFGPMQKKGSMRKKGTRLLQILINASLKMSASSFNRRPAFLCGEGLTLAS